MTLPKPPDANSIFFTLSFIAPGFIFSGVRRYLEPRKPQPPQIAVLHFLVSSTIIWLLAYAVLMGGGDTELSGRLWVSVVFVAPVILAVLLALADQFGLVRRLFVQVGFKPSEGYESAWAFKAHRLRFGAWLILPRSN